MKDNKGKGYIMDYYDDSELRNNIGKLVENLLPTNVNRVSQIELRTTLMCTSTDFHDIMDSFGICLMWVYYHSKDYYDSEYIDFFDQLIFASHLKAISGRSSRNTVERVSQDLLKLKQQKFDKLSHDRQMLMEGTTNGEIMDAVANKIFAFIERTIPVYAPREYLENLLVIIIALDCYCRGGYGRGAEMAIKVLKRYS